MHRRSILKVIIGTAASAVGSRLPAGEVQAQSAVSAHAAPLSFEAITRRERAPERLIESEPLVSIADDGKATIVWEPVIPVRSAVPQPQRASRSPRKMRRSCAAYLPNRRRG